MTVVYDALIGLLIHDHPIKRVTSDPTGAKEGDLILNTVDNKIKVRYSDSWQTLHVLDTTASYSFMDGTSFDFMDGTNFDFMGGEVDNDFDFMDGNEYELMDGLEYAFQFTS